MAEVSVIIPVYNAQAHLEQCINSVTAQTLEDIEIICVNDGSTDGSAAMLSRLAAQDGRIVVITQENAGAGAARNAGLERASGRYLSFLDADDFYEPQMLEAACRKAREEEADLVVFGADFYDERLGRFFPCVYGIREEIMPDERPFAGTQLRRDAFKAVVGWAWDKLFRAEFVRENGLAFQQQRTTNDMLFVFSALVRAGRISVLREVLAHQRRGGGATLSVTREKSWMCFYDALIALREQLYAWGLYERFEQDYINYALHFSLWNLNTLRGEAKKTLYSRLRQEWFLSLGVCGTAAKRFYHRSEYAQYRLIMALPYSAAVQHLLGAAQRGMTCLRRLLRR